VNVVVIRGRLSRPPEEKVLESGTRLVSFEVTVPRAEERAETVPVAWMDAPATAADGDAGDEVVIVGRVRRRFFRTTGGTGSRTEVLAEQVVPIRHAKRVTKALAAAVRAIEGW
jgi:single-strand DNA-binding protein